jgi:EAL domain-containing protein (putative c-di-GMP-specific phosphodiesterase class I)
MTGACLLDRILAPGGLSCVFQPIYAFHGRAPLVRGFEALARGPRDTNVASADVLFEYVRRKGEEERVDRACLANALAQAVELPASCCVTVNVHAATLIHDAAFPAFLAEQAAAGGIPTSRIVVEVVEQCPVCEAGQLAPALDAVRDTGACIALDDVGLGQSNFWMILECRPEYLKVDRYVVRGAARDPHRRAVLRSLAALAADCGAEVVAEGVESEEDLDAVLRSGIRLVQGFLLDPPLDVTVVRERFGEVLASSSPA